MGATKRGANRTAHSPNQGQALNGTAKDREEKPPPDEEQELDRRIREQLGKGPEDYSPEDWLTLRASVRLGLLYPGKHVVFRDRWKGRRDKLRLVDVKALLVTDDFKEAQNFLDHLIAVTPLHEQPYLGFTFIEPPLVFKPVPRKPRKSKSVE